MWKGSKCNNYSNLHLLSVHKEPDTVLSAFPKQSHLLVTLRKVGNSKLTEEKDGKKKKALGKSRYNLLPN